MDYKDLNKWKIFISKRNHFLMKDAWLILLKYKEIKQKQDIKKLFNNYIPN